MICENDPWRRRKKTCDLSPGRSLAYVERASEGPLVLLVHGFTDSSRSFSLIEPSLTGLGLFIPDLAGHGDSTAPESGYDIDTLAQDVASLMERLGKFPDVIVGHSLGALIALRLASHDYGGKSRLVLLAGSLKPSLGDHPPISEWVSTISDPIDPGAAFFDYWYEGIQGLPVPYLHRLRMEAAAVRPQVWRRVFKTLEVCDLTEEARKLTAPTMTIAGTEDKLFGSRHRDALCQALPACKHVLLKGVGHNPHWEQPGKTAELISDFISENPQQIPGPPRR